MPRSGREVDQGSKKLLYIHYPLVGFRRSMATKLFKQKLDGETADDLAKAKAGLDQQVAEFFRNAARGTVKLRSIPDAVDGGHTLLRVVIYREPKPV